MARQHQYLERRLSHKPLRRLASRAAVPTAAGLLVALAAIADEFGAPQFPTNEFHFVRLQYSDGAYGRGYGRWGRGSAFTDWLP